jgi:hypothetical protein
MNAFDGSALSELIVRNDWRTNGLLLLQPDKGLPHPGMAGILFVAGKGLRGHCAIRFRFRKKEGGTPYYPDNSNIVSACELVSRVSSTVWSSPPPADSRSGRLSPGVMKEVPALAAGLLEYERKNAIEVTLWSGGRRMPMGDFDAEVIATMSLVSGVAGGDAELRAADLAAGMGAELETLSFAPGREFPRHIDFASLELAMQATIPDCLVMPIATDGSAEDRSLLDQGAIILGIPAGLFGNDAASLGNILFSLAGGSQS